MRFALIVLFLICGCKKDRTYIAAEASLDGKPFVKGCVWMTTRDDDIAFCDDGRVCVRDSGDENWLCVQFVKPPAVEKCPENSSAPPPLDDGAGTSRPIGP